MQPNYEIPDPHPNTPNKAPDENIATESGEILDYNEQQNIPV